LSVSQRFAHLFKKTLGFIIKRVDRRWWICIL
jgi:hypothetical protein